jgi:pimeloyl-ACP methyl ester carboxylesterase
MSTTAKVARGDIRGAARLAVDATAGLTDLVEAMHQRIASAPGATAADGRTRGITGLVYQSVRGVTKLVGGSVDALLGLIEPALRPGGPEPLPSPTREAVASALNGVLGDHLAASHNPLAISMQWRVDGQPLTMDVAALRSRLPDARGTLVLAVHGLCMNDLQWQRQGHDHAAALATDLDGTAVYLHYNSGLAISDNGGLFASLMAPLLAAWPVPVERLVLLGHSMGGLVARSALAQAQAAGQTWPQRVTELVCLGTPHFGARLERAGHGVDLLLGAAPYAAPLARLGKVRSAGITDLRHGRVRPLVADAKASDAEATLPLPDFPGGPRCYAIAGCLGASSKSLKARLAGDGLVTVDSALGQHQDATRSLHFAPQRKAVAQGVNHMALLSDPGVYAQLLQWLRPPAVGVSGPSGAL